jgi:hypothetical protein
MRLMFSVMIAVLCGVLCSPLTAVPSDGLPKNSGAEMLTNPDPERREFADGILYHGNRPVSITYEVVNGLAVFEGDMIFGSSADVVFDGSAVQYGIIIPFVETRWDDGVVPYELDPLLAERTKGKIPQAIARWHERTDVRLVERTPRNAHLYPDYVYFTPSTGCASYVGRQGGRQELFLASACSVGNIVHEIAHAFGLWHEQSREDRDSHVRILWDNIIPDRTHNFLRHIADGYDIDGYDYLSIMHYGAGAFSSNGQPTIEPLDPSVHIGQRRRLSAGDINTIEERYYASICTSLYGGLGGSGVYRWVGFDYYPSGILFGELEGPMDANFDLLLWWWNYRQRAWEVVERGTSPTSEEYVFHRGAPGYYAWQLISNEGKGNYSLCLTAPR